MGIENKGIIRAAILVIIFFIFTGTSLTTSLRLRGEPINKTSKFKNIDEEEVELLSQRGTKYQNTNCLYALLATSINAQKGTGLTPDSLREKHTDDKETGASLFSAVKILRLEDINFRLYKAPSKNADILKLLTKYERIIVPTYLEDGFHSIMLEDYSVLGSSVFIRYFDPNYKYYNVDSLETINDQSIDYMYWIAFE